MQRWWKIGLLLGVLAGCSSWQDNPAQSTLPSGVTLIEDHLPEQNSLGVHYQKYQLDNGLTVLLYPNDDSPLTHVDVTYHVGSSREVQGKSGFAHFFEHMMFQGSKHVGDQEHFRIVNEAGGSMNGTTNKDRTNYYQTVPSNQLETVLWLEADRMGFLLEAVSERKFEIQRDAVKNERAQRVDNAPYGLMLERLDEALYPREHPYSWQPIGYVEDLDRVDVNDLKAFFLRWYGPNNAVLTIGGDFDTQQTLEWVTQYFGGIPSGPEAGKLPPQPAELDESRYITLEDRVHIPVLLMSYPTVYLGHQDEVALDMFSEVLGGGKSSLLYQRLVESGKALSASSSHYCQELACTLSVYVRLNPQSEYTLADIEAEVDLAIAEFRERGVTEEDLTRVQASLRASSIFGMESVPDVVRQLAFGETFLDDPLFVESVIAQFDAVTREQVDSAYRHYIEGKPRVVLSVVPRGKLELAAAPVNFEPEPRQWPEHHTIDPESLAYRTVNDDFDRSVQPPAGKAPQMNLPELWQVELSNGIALLGTSEHNNPTTTLRLRMPGGALSESPEHYGIAKLTAAMLKQSSQARSASALTDRLEELGASISFSAGLSDQIIEVRSLSENLEEVLGLLEDQLLRPAFDEQEFQREQARYLQSIEQRFNQSQWLASVMAQTLTFGQDSRLGSSSYGTRESIANITLEDVKAFWQQHYQPRPSQMVAVTNLSAEQLQDKLKPLVAKWQGESASAGRLSQQGQAKPGIYLIDRPGAVQTALRITRPALAYDATGDFFKANLMNFNFGGNFNSRINQNLREDKGYTYGVSSYFSGFEQGGSFVISSDIRRDATAAAISELLQELHSYMDSGPSEQELEYMRSAVTQQEALSYATPSQKASFLMLMQMYQLEPDFVEQQQLITNSISSEELQALAARFFSPEEMCIVVVGDKRALLPDLERLGLPVQEVEL